MSKQRVGFYPGTFDPVTLGHRDIFLRAAQLVDRLVIGVAINLNKGPMFTLDERVEMVREELDASESKLNGCVVEVRPYDDLTIHCAQEHGASIIIRGLRAVADFEYEYQLVGMNRQLDADIETIFIMANHEYQFIASRLVKEIAQLKGDISSFVSAPVAERLLDRVEHR
ncbi:MAG: pantetheine-phosphate adenylyltransferase [Rhodospirillaceae bacterium]|nr:pantetheine-phosphate adenylyltransferase [Rhodospirillaceae bacterium]MBT4489843.1 pantetheine-phosphate adenylyltransferase [Rhodospirillaceae bacterium]MBT5192791.1 pantetheine-phosphate adenylyltransferase [Rhodospirillaceae bacterium]MBT6427945.1 pantetheine-phosphate adenylyltransferase [Rhodospirillaceae bacterium]MBT7759187.1 pantetheine-phosphate adenylyltransferase [Rhodospirillaceae bacterium]